MSGRPRRLASLALLGSIAAAPAVRPTQTFTSDEYRFRLTFPADWIAPEHPADGTVFSARSPSRPPTAASTRPATGPAIDAFAAVTLRIDQGPEAAPDRQILRDESGGLVQYLFNHGAQHVAIHPGALGDLPARRITFVIQQAGGPTAGLYVVAVRKRITYVLGVVAPPDRMDAVRPEVEAMLGTFETLD